MKQWTLCCVAIVIMTMGAIPAGAQQPLVLFEDFEGKSLDPVKWFGMESAATGMVILEGARQMKTEPTYQYRGLYLLDRAHANTANDTGASTASNRLFFADGNIRTIQALVQVKKLKNTLCSTNTAPNEARLRFGGFYFNTGTPTPGSLSMMSLPISRSAVNPIPSNRPVFLASTGELICVLMQRAISRPLLRQQSSARLKWIKR